MNDFIWFLIIGAVLVLSGLGLILLGRTIWKKQRIDLIIRYHMDRVSEEDKPAFCRLCGIGVLLIGAGLVLSGIFAVLVRGLPAFIPMAAGVFSGTVLLIAAVARYNR